MPVANSCRPRTSQLEDCRVSETKPTTFPAASPAKYIQYLLHTTEQLSQEAELLAGMSSRHNTSVYCKNTTTGRCSELSGMGGGDGFWI